MFEDVFEPFDDIVGEDVDAPTDEWGEVWDTGEKEDVWRSGTAKDVWTAAPGTSGPSTGQIPPITQPANAPNPPGPRPTTQPANAPNPPKPVPDGKDDDQDDQDCEAVKGCESECEDCVQPSKGTGLFDDLFLDIF